MMSDLNPIRDAGYTPEQQTLFDAARADLPVEDPRPARVIAVFGDSCTVLHADGESPAYLSGRLMTGPGGSQVVAGDWVVIQRPPDAEFALIEAVLPRRTQLSRRAPGGGPTQLLAANVDIALLVQGLDRDYNPRRLERYLALVHGGGATPVIVLNKSDLLEVDERDEKSAGVRAVAGETRIIVCSAASGEGTDELQALTRPGRTFVLLGSSGAGKSTLVNRLLGFERQRTGVTSTAHGKGKHTTTTRELIVSPERGVLIDSPGLREVALDETADLGAVFTEIDALAADCRFRDCLHESEPGCAVQAAIERGDLPADRLAAYLRLQREQERLHTPESIREAKLKRRAERKTARDTGKLYKNIQARKRKERGR